MRLATVAACVAAAAVAGVVLAGSPGGDERRKVGTTATSSDSGTDVRELTRLGLTRRLPPAYRRACRRLAEYAPRDMVPCPPLVPSGPLKVEAEARFGRARPYSNAYTMSFASCSLNTYRGRAIDTNGCHWAYEVGWARRARRIVVDRVILGSGNPADPRARCRRRRLARQRVRVCRVLPFDRGGGFHGGHIVYISEQQSAAAVISAHGYRNEPRVRAMMTALIRAAAEP